jgi:hypothetical protein
MDRDAGKTNAYATRPACKRICRPNAADPVARWKPALNAFTIAFGDWFPAAENY